MRVKHFFVFFGLFINIGLINNAMAQGSGIVQPHFDTSRKTIETIVRNYDNNYIIISDYGFDPDGPTPNNPVVEYTAFYIQNIATGTLTRLFKMPYGYDVHDVRFVTLRRDSLGTQSKNYCCFCGTKKRFIGEYYGYTIGDEPPVIEYLFDSAGFAGFFSMDDAIDVAVNPLLPTIATAKIRDVEGTASLYRMTCYAEGPCHYISGSFFYDNAVLDMIGITADSLGANPCFSRAKFYPEYGGSILWDNNLRYNNQGDEILCDITGTDNNVITVSRYKNNRHDVFIRQSSKEIPGQIGGTSLNYNTKLLDWESLQICGLDRNFGNEVKFEDSLRLCHLTGDNFALALGFESNDIKGILTFRFYNSYIDSAKDGRFEAGNNRLREIIYLRRPIVTVTLTHDGNPYNSTAKFNTWDVNSQCAYYDYIINTPVHYQQSVTIHNDYNLFWGCIPSNPNYQFSLMSYSYPFALDNDECSTKKEDDIIKSSIKLKDNYSYLPITKKYKYNVINHPVYYLNFIPQVFEINTVCDGVN